MRKPTTTLAMIEFADTMAAGWARGATAEQIDAAERAAARWRELRRHHEFTVPTIETRSA